MPSLPFFFLSVFSFMHAFSIVCADLIVPAGATGRCLVSFLAFFPFAFYLSGWRHMQDGEYGEREIFFSRWDLGLGFEDLGSGLETEPDCGACWILLKGFALAWGCLRFGSWPVLKSR